MSEVIVRSAGISDRKTRLLPGPVKERDGAMIEYVQELRQRVVLGPAALQDQLAVRVGQHALGTSKPHEVHRHLRWAALRRFQLLNLAGRKAQPRIDAEMHRLLFGIGKASHRAGSGVESLE